MKKKQARREDAKARKEEGEKIRESGIPPQEILSLELQEEHTRIKEMIKGYLFEAYIYYIINPPNVHVPPLSISEWIYSFELKSRGLRVFDEAYEISEEDYLIREKYLKQFMKENNGTFILTFTK